MIEYQGYKVADPEGLETPAMVIFEEKLDHNIKTVCELVGGGENVMVHVKTHKSAAVTKKQLEAGVAGFKCATLKELEMVLEVGGKEAVLSYPLVQKSKVERLADLIKEYPESLVYAMASAARHVELLGAVAQERQIQVAVLLDLDVGMHRTGVSLGEPAMQLYRSVAGQPYLEAAGFHIYDGHEHIVDQAERAAAAQRHIDEARALKGQLEAEGLSVGRIIAGGSFTFVYYARAEGMRGTPGTNIYWDVSYGEALAEMPFNWAALVLTQVVDRYAPEQIVTTDLGVKAISADPPLERRARLLGYEGAQLVIQNEEHGVFKWEGEMPQVGDYLLAVPGHVCPTTIRYPGSYVLDGEGAVVDYYPHTARDRQ